MLTAELDRQRQALSLYFPDFLSLSDCSSVDDQQSDVTSTKRQLTQDQFLGRALKNNIEDTFEELRPKPISYRFI